MKTLNKIPFYVRLTPQQDRQHREENAVRWVPYVRAAGIFGTIVCPLWLFWDIFVAHADAATMPALIALRVTHAAFFFFVFCLSFLPRAHKTTEIISTLIVFFSVFNIALVLTHVENGFAMGLAGMIIPFVPLPILPTFRAAFGAVLISVVGVNVIMIENAQSLTTILNCDFFLFTFSLLGLMFSYLMVQTRRRAFLMDIDLAQAKKAAESASEAKSSFLATMSHEVRTPLNGILGIVSLLKDTRLNAQQVDYVETVRYSGETLLTMLNDILDFSKMEAGKMKIEPLDFNLERTVKGVISLMKSRASEKGIVLNYTINLDVPEYIKTDPTRLRQVLLNLVSNAIKFTESGSVSVTVRNMAEDGDNARLKFEVSDTGIGMSQETQKNLFSDFAQADSSIARRYGGTGLGLAICRKIIEIMGGKIAVESLPGSGSTFWFEIPVLVSDYDPFLAETDAEEAANEAFPILKPLRILVAEDNIINQKVVRGLLEKHGHRVTIVGNGVECLAFLEQNRNFDMILMDMQMPQMDGLEATKLLREKGGWHDRIPVIALTANAMRGDEERCLAAGMNDFVSKPISPQAFYKTLARHAPKDGEGGTAVAQTAPTKPERTSAEKKIDLSSLMDLEQLLGRAAIEGFMTEGLVELRRLINAVIIECKNQESVDELQHAAHEVKSLAAMFGLNEVQALAEGIEMCCFEKRYNEARALGGLLQERYDNGVKVLQKSYAESSHS